MKKFSSTRLDRISEKLLRWIPINIRLSLSLIAMALIPVCIVGFIAASSALDEIERNIGSYTQKMMGQVLNKFTDQLASIESLAIEMRTSEQILNYIKTRDSSDAATKVAAEDAIRAYFKERKMNYGFIDTFALYTDKSVYKAGETILIDSSAKGGLFDEILATDGKPVWRYIDKSDTGTDVKSLALFVKIKHPTSGNVAVLQLLTSKTAMKKIASELKLEEDGGTIFLLNKDNIILASNQSSVEEGLVIQEDIIKGYVPAQNEQESHSSHTLIDIDGVEMLASYNVAPQPLSWKVVSIVPLENLMKNTRRMAESVIMISVISLLAAIFISSLVTKSVYGPMSRLNRAVSKLKEGDLTQDLADPYKDEIGLLSHNFTDMVASIGNIIRKVRTASSNVVKSAESIANFCNQSRYSLEQIASAMEDVAYGSTHQHEEAQSANKAMNRLAESLNEIVANARDAYEATEKTKALSENANEVIESLNEKADISNSATNSIIGGILELSADMKKISDIIKIISSISDQTDLLALNASIEAARAGKAGLGFVVVAEEVKKLSYQSRESSEKIAQIIAQIQKKVNAISGEAHHTKAAIEEQMQAVKHTDETFRIITDSTIGISSRLQQMMSGINSMESQKNTTVDSVSRILGITEGFAASTQEINATTEEQISSAIQLESLAREMNTLAVNLEQSIQQFKI